MAKINLADVANGTGAISTINANSAVIEAASDDFLSRSGKGPNEMTADLNMNSKKILNLPPAATATEPVTLSQLEAWAPQNTNVGVTNGNKGDITVTNDGATWLLNTRNINAATNIVGTIPPANLGSGTADSTTFLRGDNTWAAVAGPGGALPPDNPYGDITVTSSGTTWTINPGAVSHSKYQNLAADRLLGTDTSSGPPTEIPCTSVGRGLIAATSTANARTSLGLGTLSTLNTVATANITDGNVTLGKIENIPPEYVLGRASGVTGPVSLIQCTTTGRTLLASSDANQARDSIIAAAASHTHGAADITTVNASAINSGTGTINPTKLATSGTPSTSTVLRGDGVWSSALGTGTILTSTSNLNGDNILSGKVPPAQLGTGAPSSGVFLRGDGIWASAPGASSGFAPAGIIATGAQYSTIPASSPEADLFIIPAFPDNIIEFGGATFVDGVVTLNVGATRDYRLTFTGNFIRESGTATYTLFVGINHVKNITYGVYSIPSNVNNQQVVFDAVLKALPAGTVVTIRHASTVAGTAAVFNSTNLSVLRISTA